LKSEAEKESNSASLMNVSRRILEFLRFLRERGINSGSTALRPTARSQTS